MSQGASHCERGREMIVTFTISGEDIPRIVDQPIRSLGRLYTSGLSDKDMGKIILWQLSEGLSKIDVVLSLHLVPKGDVSSKVVRSHLISSKSDGGKNQLLHPQIGASRPSYGPRQARRRGRTLLLQRSPGRAQSEVCGTGAVGVVDNLGGFEV